MFERQAFRDSQWPGSGGGGGAMPPKKPAQAGDEAIELEAGGTKAVTPQPVAPQPVEPVRSTKIRTFDQKLMGGRHEDSWNRTPNSTGTGAIHVKSFYCKLTPESLSYLDEQINEWLDAHPQYEVKFVTTSIGEWTGKTKEPAMICNVWV